MATEATDDLQVRRYADAEAFYRAAEPILVAREAENCLPLGIATTLLTHPERYPDPYLVTIEVDGEVAGIAVRTPPYNLVLAAVSTNDGPPDAREQVVLDALASDVRALYGVALPGVSGPAAWSRAFADLWARALAVEATVSMSQRIYRLDTVFQPTGVPGQMRRAEERDRDLMARWVVAFEDEALTGAQTDAQAWVDWALSAPVEVRGIYFWEDGGQPVSMAGYTGPTPRGMRIGPVYTPLELRGRGYASALTAGVTQFALTELGKQFTFLFTDQANPISNKIYQQIGYRPVIDWLMYAFATKGA